MWKNCLMKNWLNICFQKEMNKNISNGSANHWLWLQQEFIPARLAQVTVWWEWLTSWSVEEKKQGKFSTSFTFWLSPCSIQMVWKWATIEWTFTVRISTGFTFFPICNFNQLALLSNPSCKTLDSSFTLFSTFTAMPTRRAVSFSATQSITPASKYKASYSPNTYHQFVSIWSSRHAISAKSKSHQKIEAKIFRNKDVQELLSTNGPIRPIATPWRPASLKM